MSLILYYKGELTVDSSGLDIREYKGMVEYSPCDVVKSYVTPDKRIAIAYSGNEIDPSSPAFKSQMAVFRKVLKSAKGGSLDIELRCDVEEAYVKTLFFVMTKDVCFELVRIQPRLDCPGFYGYLHPLNQNDYTFAGSGQDAGEFLAAAEPGITAADIFALVGRYMAGMWETRLDIVSHADLKPF